MEKSWWRQKGWSQGREIGQRRSRASGDGGDDHIDAHTDDDHDHDHDHIDAHTDDDGHVDDDDHDWENIGSVVSEYSVNLMPWLHSSTHLHLQCISLSTILRKDI